MPTRDEVLELTEEVRTLAGEVHDEKQAKRWALRVAAVVLVAVVALGAWSWQNNASRIDAINSSRHASCVEAASNREAVRELVKVATSSPDVDLTALFATDEFKRLDPPNQAVWRLVLTGLSTSDQPSTSQRLNDFARSLKPIECP